MVLAEYVRQNADILVHLMLNNLVEPVLEEGNGLSSGIPTTTNEAIANFGPEGGRILVGADCCTCRDDNVCRSQEHIFFSLEVRHPSGTPLWCWPDKAANSQAVYAVAWSSIHDDKQ